MVGMHYFVTSVYERGSGSQNGVFIGMTSGWDFDWDLLTGVDFLHARYFEIRIDGYVRVYIC
jgi:hypothetical protein